MDSLQKQHTDAVSRPPATNNQLAQAPVPAKRGRRKLTSNVAVAAAPPPHRHFCPIFYLFKTFQKVPFVDDQLRKCINYLKRAEMLEGKINFLSHLTYFKNEPFFIMIDEYHIPHMTFLPIPKWKVLAIAASNVSATAFKYLYIRVVPVTDESRLGSRKIWYALDEVLSKIIKTGYRNNLLAVVTDHCRANLDIIGRCAAKFPNFPILWDKNYMVNNMAKRLITDNMLNYLYGQTYTHTNWEFKLRNVPELNNSMDDGLRLSYQNEVLMFRKMLQRYFSNSKDPLIAHKISSDRLESLGTALGRKIVEIMLYAANLHPQKELRQCPLYYLARVVGIIILLTTPKTMNDLKDEMDSSVDKVGRAVQLQ